MCALVRIPGYQVSFKNCPKEFDIREMAARRACHGPALYTRSSKPRYYGVRRSFEIWMDASPIPPRKPYDSNFYSQIRTYYPCTLANDASKRVKYLKIHQRRYFSCQRKGKIFSLSPSIEARRHESRRFFLRSFRFFPLLVHGRSTVYRSSKPPLPCPTWWFRVWLVHSLAR